MGEWKEIWLDSTMLAEANVLAHRNGYGDRVDAFLTDFLATALEAGEEHWCAACGEAFWTQNPRRRYCSPRCKRRGPTPPDVVRSNITGALARLAQVRYPVQYASYVEHGTRKAPPVEMIHEDDLPDSQGDE